MRKYEIMVVLKPLLPDDIRRATLDKVEKAVSALGGKVEKSEVWGKRHLAYEIKGHADGYYVLWGVSIEPIEAHKLDKELRLLTDILRFVVLEVEKFDLKEIK